MVAWLCRGIACTAAAVIVGACGASTPPPPSRIVAPAAASASTRDTALDAYLARAAGFGFSGAFLIARNDSILLHEGYGDADREQGVPVTAETVFDIGSITKQFTAAGILKLEEQGRLRVEDSIGRFLPNVPQDKQAITLHHLLTHTSGLIGDLGGDYQIMSRDSVVAGALRSELQWAPGSRYDYSNLGYSLLGAIIEIASGESYERFLHDHLFVPAGMRRTGYRLPTWTADELAIGYREGRRWGTPLDHAWAPDGPWWNLRANGGILSTMGDLYRWHLALQAGHVLSARSRDKLFTPHVAENPEGTFHYGYGWAITRTPRGTRLVMHNGGNGYFFADFLRYIDEDAVVILATNDASQAVTIVRERILAAVFSGNAPTLPPAASDQPDESGLRSYEGAYLLPSGGRIVVTLAGGRLQADALGQAATELLAGTPAAMRDEHRTLNERADSVISAVAREDFTALHRASANPDRAQAILQRIWQQSAENLGALRSIDVLGTVDDWWSDEDGPVTFVRLNRERGARLFRVHWSNGRISGWGGMAIPNPARTTLVPQGQHRFIGYNLGIEREVPIRFEFAGTGRVAVMVVGSPDGDVRASRIPE